VKALPTSATKASTNPPNGSWGMIKVQPPSVGRLGFNDPPTAGGGIRSGGCAVGRLGFNDPPTAGGGIREVIFLRAPNLKSVLLIVALTAATAFAQQPQSDLDKAPRPAEQSPTRDRKVKEQKPAEAAGSVTGEERNRLRRETPSEEEAALLPYINNFFTTQRLGPEDVISVDVFEQPNYSRPSITIPPSGRINYPHIGQIMVAGRTAEDLEKEITGKLSEYIRQPVVTVQILQVHSLKFMVIGDVTSPGIYEMTKRMTVTEALARAGYVTRYGDLKNVNVLRMQPSGQPIPIPINMKEVTKGKVEDIFLAPGDTVVVPGNMFKTVEKALGLLSASFWVRAIVR
ncbi:MAG: polysaccharide biosynthesis/export family protein, partial [Blastocatellia bacterium]